MATKSLAKVLMVPGLGSSGPQHWQTLWESQLDESERIEQREWDNPVCPDWTANIDAAVLKHGTKVVLVGHSCGSLAIVHWARDYNRPIAGVMLVAPSDVEMPGFPYVTVGFAPIPLDPLPFPSVVVASSEDPYAPFERSRHFAASWGSDFVSVGPAGHINAASGHGCWPEGLELLRAFLKRCSQQTAGA